MHTFGETGAGVPAFLAKLWRLVDDPETNNLICWSKDGRSFIIQNQAQFARELLPLNYKHNNMASFIRQLNMYGFHKITSIDNGGLKFDKDEMEFSHPCFKRNCPYLLEHIKRKIASSKTLEDKSLKPEAVSKVLQDVKAMRGRQDSLDSRFSVMKQENEALWREIASLRQKHAKQQQIVNKLIQFLITIVQPTRNVSGVKRHMQLMINDTPENICKNLCKSNDSELDCGPVIHELGEELLEEVADTDSELTDSNSPYNRIYTNYPDHESPSPNIEQPQSSMNLTSQNYDVNSNQSMDDALSAGPSSTYSGSSPFTNSGMSIIQSVNPDGSKIVYHVTEVPEQSHDAPKVASPNYNEDNVLTTPMVRKEMLKEKNRGRRKPASGGSAKVARLEQKQSQQKESNTLSPKTMEPVQVKTEQQEIDPIMFLNAFNDNNPNAAPSVSLLSPNVSEESLQSDNMNAGIMGVAAASGVSNPSQMYISNNFISDDMPTNLFEDTNFLGGENSNIGTDLEASPQQQQPTLGATVPSGKFSSYIASSNGGGGGKLISGASTSSAAAGSSSFSGNADAIVTASTSGTKVQKNGDNMTVAKYKDNGSNQNDLREEVNGHLDSVQDELETLKDLLRGDGYSLDANTLMGLLELTKPQNASTANNNKIPTLDYEFLNKLFNDSDILGAYGLSSLPMDSSMPKSGPGFSGSELMSYQPLSDLSDIIDNKELDADAVTGNVTPNKSQILNSSLNTPVHE